ncbi:topology modulation protein [Erythrobacter crassostreae]|uniref:Topology modulation protein n=1 Tax=Erythrobacter crassostreae TaxID=2828328 RepID=A0A9X1JMZ8_9SPHN|nr:topology modulation protein [Erythrobacter crassostrea]MBV7259944.1 topology modulation protein [Erythrobacter crassostrea]
MVIGPCGAGKSTVSGKLAAMLDLPLIHIDQLHWSAGWVEGGREELKTSLGSITAQDRWVIDGNYKGSMDVRLERADTVVYLDYPIPLCFWRAVKRVWKYHGRSRPDMTEGCPERFDPEFFLYIINWNRKVRPITEALLAKTQTPILRFKHPDALEAWLNSLETTA